MRKLKNKEIIAGLFLLIILSIIAMVLIVKREIGQNENKNSGVVVGSEKSEAAEAKPSKEETQTTEVAMADTIQTNMAADKVTASLTTGYYTKASMKENRKEDTQMSELFFYWDAYKLDAVDDLIRLDRVRKLTNALAGTNEYYYYGETNKNGEPEGKGLAIYADNAYYCGEWKNGVRSGNGMWIKIYPDQAVILNGVKGVTAHSYNGTFVNDYPNGKGQEHFDYDFEKIDKESIANVIGEFKDGYYDGELYIMTVVSASDTNDWSATARKGSFLPLEDNKNSQGEDPVWKRMEDGEEDNFTWMKQSVNKNWGIFDLLK